MRSKAVIALALFAACSSGQDLHVDPEPTTGSLTVRVSTSGSRPDPDGYALLVDGGSEQTSALNDTLVYGGLSLGSHVVALSGIAGNCAVVGEHPRTINVSAGQEAVIEIAVSCPTPPPTSGSIRVTSSTAGPSPDTDGYHVTVDDGSPYDLGVNSEFVISNISAGKRNVRLSGVAANCSVGGANPREVTVTAGADASVAFAVTCAPPPPTFGSIKVTTSTTGPDRDADGYTVTIDDGTPQALGLNTSLTIPDLAPGEHTVRFAGAATNCIRQGANPRDVTVEAAKTATVAFTVVCKSAPSMRIDLAPATSSAPDELVSYRLQVSSRMPGVAPTGQFNVWVSGGNETCGGGLTPRSNSALDSASFGACLIRFQVGGENRIVRIKYEGDARFGPAELTFEHDVTNSNRPPEAFVQSDWSYLNPGQVVEWRLPVTDPDGDLVTTYEIVRWPSSGTLDVRPDGSFTYTASASFQYDYIEFRGYDGRAWSNVGVIDWTLPPAE